MNTVSAYSQLPISQMRWNAAYGQQPQVRTREATSQTSALEQSIEETDAAAQRAMSAVDRVELMGEAPPSTTLLTPSAITDDSDSSPVTSTEQQDVAGVSTDTSEETSQIAASVSAEAQETDTEEMSPEQGTAQDSEDADGEEADEAAQADLSRPRASNGEPLSDAQVRQVNELERIDAEIRQHEQAHLAAAGGNARSGISFEYQTGPDGKRYAVGGEVNIDTSPESTPEATMQKMQAVKRAALAPAQPSTQDRRVASLADRRISAARQEISQMRMMEARARMESQAARNETNDSDAAEPTQASASADTTATASSATSDESAAFTPTNDSAYAQRLEEIATYRQVNKPQLLTPDGRAMQPGYSSNAGFGLITTLEPAPGSMAERLLEERQTPVDIMA